MYLLLFLQGQLYVGGVRLALFCSHVQVWQVKPGYFLLKRLVLLSLWFAFCRCCHDQVSVADKCNFSFGGWGEGETTKEKPISEHHSRAGGEQTAYWNSPPTIKDVLHSDLSEEQSRSTPCFDSLFCVEEMKAQRVQGQEITSVAALKNCSGLLPLGTTEDSLHGKVACRGLFPLNSLRFRKKALLFQCIVLLFWKP